MLGKFIKVNGEAFPNPNPGTFSDNFEPIENTFVTEAGTTLANIVRLNKYKFSAEFNCTSDLKSRIVRLVQSPSIVCEVDGIQYEGRLRLSSSNLVANSENIGGTSGLWVIALTFEQF